ncbi:MAG: GGDEF domain-containing protein [Schwartzia sp.]|nr:GGDEF domain-containing protein [Schwartzia sp. (in: firmicutes)]
MNDSLTRQSVLLFASFILLFYGLMIFLPEYAGPVSNAGSVLGDAIALVILGAGLRRWPQTRQLAWKLFFVGIVIYLVGDAIWVYEEEALGLEVESPSIPDFFYLSSTLVCFFALLRYIRDEKTIDVATAGFDILISIVASGGLLYNYVMLPVSSFKEMDFWQAVVMLAYPVADVVYLLGFFSLVFGMERRHARNGRNFLLGAGLLLMFFADQTYLVQSITEYVSGGLLDPVWSMSFGFIAMASLRVPDWEEMSQKETVERVVWLEYLRMLLPYLLTVLILLLVGMEYGLIGSPFFVGALLLLVLLSVRQVVVLIGNRKLLAVISENERELHRKNLELQKLNYHFMTESETDFLTKLLNRRAIVQSFERLKPIGEEPETLGLLLVDVDNFKRINDTYGHQKGDDALVGVAESIRHTIRGDDIGGRFGGDEFLVLLPGANDEAVERVAERLREAAAKNETLTEMNITLSVGGASWSVGREDYRPNKLLRQADEALYVAKEKGRDRFVMYREDLADEI